MIDTPSKKRQLGAEMEKWRRNIRQVEPYVPGEQPKGLKDLIKLNTNENPYPPAPGVGLKKEQMETESFRLYPDDKSTVLVQALARYYGLEENQIFVGVGSDDVLATAFLTFFNSEEPVLFPDVTYSFYDVWAELYRIPYRKQAVDEKLHIIREDYYKKNGGIVLANPNAPTGILEPVSFIRDVLDHNTDSIIIVDEAYIDFGGTSAMCLLEEYPNLLVVQTFSKSRSMAGMRIGFAAGSRELISAIQAVRNSYNSYTMNLPSQLLGAESVYDSDYFKETTNMIISTREWCKERFTRLGFTYPDSTANFLFVRHHSVDAQEIAASLRSRNILVRHFSGERVRDFLRITIGTRDQMDKLFAALEVIVGTVAV